MSSGTSTEIDAKSLALDVIDYIFDDLLDWCIENSELPPANPDELPNYLRDQLVTRKEESNNYAEYSPTEIIAAIAQYGATHGQYLDIEARKHISNVRDFWSIGSEITAELIQRAVAAEIGAMFNKMNSIDFDFFAEEDEDGEPIEEGDRPEIIKEWLRYELSTTLETYR